MERGGCCDFGSREPLIKKLLSLLKIFHPIVQLLNPRNRHLVLKLSKSNCKAETISLEVLKMLGSGWCMFGESYAHTHKLLLS